MARTFRRQRQTHPIAEMNVTNLIDLGFTLLIIFMIATPLITQDQTVPVNLPVESKAPQERPKMNETFISVTVDSKGAYYLDNRPISIGDLKSRLRAYGAEKRPPTVRIRGDGRAFYEKVADIFAELTKDGLSKVTIDYQTR